MEQVWAFYISKEFWEFERAIKNMAGLETEHSEARS